MYFGLYSPRKLPILSDSAMYVLLYLYVNGPSHGYGILTGVKSISNYGCDILSATLYRTLERFIKQELINIMNVYEEQKIYEITQKGVDTLYKQYSRIREQNKILDLYLR